MRHYFVVENNQQLGPFTVEDLKLKKIRKSTSVWCEGMTDWAPAETVEEIKDFLIADPPPIPNQNGTSQNLSLPKITALNVDLNTLKMFAAVASIILFSLFNWIKISLWGDYCLKSTLFGIVSKLNHRDLRYFLDGLEEFTFIRVVSVILVIAMILSFILLITSLVMKSQSKAKPTLAYSGFGLSAIVAIIFIIAMIYVSTQVDQWILTVFPFLTLVVAIMAMIFVVKHSTKSDDSNQQNMKYDMKYEKFIEKGEGWLIISIVVVMILGIILLMNC